MNPRARDVVARLQRAGHAAYLAGGCVRDHLLGIEAKDWDVATSATAEEVQDLFAGRVTDLVGKSFGVVRVREGEEFFEVAMFRQEGAYLDGRHPSTVTPATPEEDAQRRDFTINGMFLDPMAEKLIDFVGGKADLDAKILRAIGDPEKRFAEDHLRLLRAIRFAVRLKFQIEPKTWEAIRANAAMIRTVSAERVRDELNRIFTVAKPEKGLDLLDQSGLLVHVLPDIAGLHGVEQPPQFHPEGDVFEHTRLMLTKVQQPDLELALGILFHDVGKKPTAKVDENGRIRFNEHESVGAEMAEKIMTGLRYDNKTIANVKEMVRHHMQFKDVRHMRPSTLKKMMQRPTFVKELELHRIDCSSSHGDLEHWEFLKHQLDTMTPEEINPPSLISGHDLMKLGVLPGKQMGRILEAVKTAQLNGEVQTRHEAMALARRLAAQGMDTVQLPPPPEKPPEKPPQDEPPPEKPPGGQPPA
ncbi:MAG TPA: CCA tRNA nucleotidyltransferase [Candidatus Methylacidiphilales bacterium]|jgi:poly(A) polymerase|nr:CCA tRNA nucleotidyltransferase [Candidatus Methylacidiphilales bacterium]